MWLLTAMPRASNGPSKLYYMGENALDDIPQDEYTSHSSRRSGACAGIVLFLYMQGEP